MNRWTQLTGTCFLGAVLAAGAPSLGAQGSDETPAALVEEVRTQLATELDDLDAFDIDRWQREVLIEHGTLDPLLIELERLEDDKSHPRARRKNAQWVRGLLLARQGDLREALDLIEDFARGSKATLEAKLEKARLLDALGRESKALKEYEEFLPEITDELLEAAVRTRVALLKMAQDSEQAGALAEFAGAEGRDPGLRNRAAVVLGLIGRPADAMELFAVNGVETKRFRQEVRVAEWAIRAGAAETAQDYAWRAVSSAKLRRDRHYGLTILVEAHRLDDSLAALDPGDVRVYHILDFLWPDTGTDAMDGLLFIGVLVLADWTDVWDVGTVEFGFGE